VRGSLAMSTALAMATGSIGTCDVWELSRRRGSVEGELALKDAPRLTEQLADARGALRYRLVGLVDELGRAGARFEVDGMVRARCDRCGAAVEVPIHECAQFYFVADEAELGRLPIDESPEEPLLGSHRFDLASLVEDQAMLALPISPRHDDCAAPAPAKGDRGPGGETHRPFEALAALKKPKQ
jgi:uncharacterized protein